MNFKLKQCERFEKSLACAIFGLTLSVMVLVFNLTVQSENKGSVSIRVLNEPSSENLENILFQDRTPFRELKKTDEFAFSVSSESDGFAGSFLRGKDGQTKENTTDALVYRKRRYLQFPEGSSFQLVFDILLPVRDYTNYAILGVTCALAFELPSKPLSELEEDLLEKLREGEYGQNTQEISRNDSSQNSDYVDAQHIQNRIKDKFSDVIYVHPSEYEHRFHHKPSIYQNEAFGLKEHTKYIPRPSYYVPQQNRPIYYTNNYLKSPSYLSPTKNIKFDAGNPFESPWVSGHYNRPNLRRHDNKPKRKQHAVYHIIAKRSDQGSHSNNEKSTIAEASNPWLEKLDRIHLQYHRSSRHALYSKIEAMFNRQGKNGTECVLRALCETGQRKHQTEPEGVVTEVLRAVFTLPEADAETRIKNYLPIHRARDEAHANQQNCAEEYPLCENFIWEWKPNFTHEATEHFINSHVVSS